MSRRDSGLSWVIIIVIIFIALPFLACYKAAEGTKKWVLSEWTPQRKRFWFSSLIGLLVLGAIAVLIAVKAVSR